MIDDSNVTAPPHYAGDGAIECRRAQLSMAAGYDRAACPSCVAHWALTAVKYLWRAPLKNGLQDYRKAREYLDYIIDYMEGSE